MSIVYVLHAKEVKKIKIGFTTDMSRRFSEIQAMCPVELEIVRQEPWGSADLEKTIHSLAYKWRSHGEWFHEDALDQFDRWVEICRRAAHDVAQDITHYLSAEDLPRVVSLLAAAGAKNIANEIGNLTGQSIMDRRFA